MDTARTSLPAATAPSRSGDRRVATWIGLAISLLSIPALVAVQRTTTGAPQSNLQLLLREAMVFAAAACLFWITLRWERLPLSSIGLHFDRLARSILRGFVCGLVLLALTVGLYLTLQKLGYTLGTEAKDAFRPSILMVLVVVVRAGVVEEIFYRGFSIERLKGLTNSPLTAALLPLIAFTAAHYRQGAAGMITVFVLGAFLTAFYLRFRDLVANITAHILTDFSLNVLLPLISGS